VGRRGCAVPELPDEWQRGSPARWRPEQEGGGGRGVPEGHYHRGEQGAHPWPLGR